MDEQEKSEKILTPSENAEGVRIDLHCHSVHSGDSVLTIPEIVEIASCRGFDGIALTDHNSVAGHDELSEMGSDLMLIPGCEISTAEGHMLAYGIEEAPASQRSLKETIDHVISLGGVPILSHPFRAVHAVGIQEIEEYREIGFEGLNGRSWQRYNERAMRIGIEQGRTMTGGSDGHSREEIGRAWTIFPPEVRTVKLALEALRNGMVKPGGRGLFITGMGRLKVKGTKRWLDNYLGGEE